MIFNGGMQLSKGQTKQILRLIKKANELKTEMNINDSCAKSLD